MYLPVVGVHCTAGGQGALTHVTLTSEHISPSEHPPLSRSHDGSQNGLPVGSYTLHWEPVGHLKPVQGSVNMHTCYVFQIQVVYCLAMYNYNT